MAVLLGSVFGILASRVVSMLFTVRPVLYDWNDEKQAHSAHDDLLRAAGAARPSRRGDLLRHQAGARELDRELLAGAPHDRLRRAGAARGRGPARRPVRREGGPRPPPSPPPPPPRAGPPAGRLR